MIIGDKAPEFSLFNEMAKKIELSHFIGQNIVLYFYPKDDTPGCVQEAQGFQSIVGELSELSNVVFGISRDSISSHHNFKKKYNLPFSVLSDDGAEIIKKYGVWVEKSMFGKKYMGVDRSTFLIDKSGTIVKIWKKVRVGEHAQQVLDACKIIYVI